MKISKRIFSFLLVCVIAFSTLTFSASAISYTDGTLLYEIDNDFTHAVIVGVEDGVELSENFVIPSSFYNLPVTGIEKNVFVNDSTVKNVTFEENSKIAYIGKGAFGFCSSLESITIPASVGYIGDGAFLGCSNLQSVNVKNDSVKVETNAFYNCYNLKTFNTNNISQIGENAFFNTGLEKIIINSSVTELPDYCFAYCTNLDTIVIRGKSTVIYPTAFYNDTLDYTVVCNQNSTALEFANDNGLNKYILGDVDLNGSIKIRDITSLQMHSAKMLELSDFSLVTGDVNFDGRLNVRDITVIQQYLARVISEF